MADKEKIIQWFPGHMAKTRRLMKEHLPLVDAVVELRDSRIVHASRNPEIEKIVGTKPRIILLNKADMSDAKITKVWCEFFAKKGIVAISVDCRSGNGIKNFTPAVREAASETLERLKRRGMGARPLRLMIVGIPNVGKSSFINRMAGARRTKVEDRPGVTRGVQWIKLDDGVELLDMPGVLWPKFEDPQVGRNLAYTGAVKAAVMDTEDLACSLLEILRVRYKTALCARYSLTVEEIAVGSGYDLLCLIAKKRKMIIARGELDTLRASITLLDEFRGGKIGKISLEVPRTYQYDKE